MIDQPFCWARGGKANDYLGVAFGVDECQPFCWTRGGKPMTIWSGRVYLPHDSWVYAPWPAGLCSWARWQARQKRIPSCRLSHVGTRHCPLPRCSFSTSVGTQELQTLPPLPRSLSKAYRMAPFITTSRSCRRTWVFPGVFSQRTFPHANSVSAKEHKAVAAR